MMRTWQKTCSKYFNNIITTRFNFSVIIGLLIYVIISADHAYANDIDQSCIGENLIHRLPADELARIRAEAAQIPNGQGLFWKVSKKGQQPSWLYGTMHVTDPRVLNLSQSVKDVIDNSDIVVIETLDLLDPVKAQSAIFMNPNLTMLTDGQTLTSLMRPEDKVFVKAELEKRGISFSLVSGMKPWMLIGLVSISDCEKARMASGQQILDFQIINRGKELNKDLEGLETVVEQFSAMDSLPIDLQLSGLIEALQMGDLSTDAMETTIQLYIEQNLALIVPVLQAVSEQLFQKKADQDNFGIFNEKLILARNYLMAKRAEPLLEKGNAFIAIGALHLPGEEGVIELLRKQGYAVSRM